LPRSVGTPSVPPAIRDGKPRRDADPEIVAVTSEDRVWAEMDANERDHLGGRRSDPRRPGRRADPRSLMDPGRILTSTCVDRPTS